MTGDVLGRAVELGDAAAALDHLDEGPLAIVIEGDAGIGKTTLWGAAAELAAERGAHLLVARPTEAEVRLTFSALADLLVGLPIERFASLPPPQIKALNVALLRFEPDEGGIDPRAATAGALALLHALAEERPVLVAIDDVQWLDRASRDALTFAIRRLGTSRIGLLIAARPDERSAQLGIDTALPTRRIKRIRLGPIGPGALYQLFVDRLGQALPRATVVRIAEASKGNPFDALEIARAMLEAGHRDPSAPLPVPSSIDGLAGERIRRLPDETRLELLRVASLARPTTALIDASRLGPAEDAGLVEISLDGDVAFTHPL